MSANRFAPEIVAKPWRDRSNTIGLLPGKGTGQADALRAVAVQLPIPADGVVEVTSAQGKARTVPADELFSRQLTRGAFVMKDASGRWVTTTQVQHWLETSDDLYLARHIQANVKFFAELLAAIDSDTRPANLLDLAHNFGMHWTSADQVNRRLSWMQSLGLAERWSTSRMVVTERGRSFLQEVKAVASEDACVGESLDECDFADLPEGNDAIRKTLNSMQPDSLASRRILIGYIPRGRKVSTRVEPTDRSDRIVDAVRNFIELLEDNASTDEIFTRAVDALNQKKSSFTQSMHTFRNMGLIDHISFNRYAPTPNAELLQPGNEIDLVRYLHTKYRFFGEMLSILNSTTSVSDLANAANTEYGCGQIDNSEVRSRLNFLMDAGLVERIDWTRYRVTGRGKTLASELPLEPPNSRSATNSTSKFQDEPVPREFTESDGEMVAALANDLVKFANASDLSEEFERSVARAFELLGFRAEHLGGKGRTDVLVQAELPPSDRFRAIVDAKASASGIIGDNAIKFDALKDHLKKHRADHGLVIGPDFSPRVKEWADNNGFALLTVDELSGMIERQRLTPLTVRDLRELFDRPASDLSAIDEKYDTANHLTDLVIKILEIINQEANDEDPVADGYMSLENIQFVLRKELNPRPSRDDIDQCLEFLSGSVVRALQKNKDRYKLADAPANVGRRLKGLGLSLAKVTVDEI